ncbi:MAG: hypothetical protein K9M07_02415 [Simkaniaceae bacterium]|nr:hypothetical protein [Simkaniaceae bacterium]
MRTTPTSEQVAVNPNNQSNQFKPNTLLPINPFGKGVAFTASSNKDLTAQRVQKIVGVFF